MVEESVETEDVSKDDSLFQQDEFQTDLDEVPRPKRAKKLKKRDSSKKKKIDVSAFLDTEAQVGDDEDDNYEYDFLLPDESTEAERLENRSRLRRLQEDASKREGRRVGGTGYLETAIDKLAKRYQDQTFEEGEEDREVPEPVDYEPIDETSALLPDLGDPKLWIVRTNRQTPDRNLAISLMNKFLRFQSQGKSLGIYSCFVPDGVSGYLYVEADSKHNVTEALSEFRQINLSTLKLVPINEMSNVFTTGYENLYIPRIGEYVRVKFGRYAGDLGQVYESDENSGTVTLKLIPRIDPQLLHASDHYVNPYHSTHSVNLAEPSDLGSLGDVVDKGDSDRVRMNRGKSQRFSRAFFDRDAMEMSGGLIEHGLIPGTFRFQGMTFLESGHILVKFSARRLICGEAVNASVAELREFSPGSDLTEALSRLSRGQRPSLYKLGERVRVVRGELSSVTGRIVGLEGGEVEVQPDDSELPNFRIGLNAVVKHIVEGDNVRAISGVHEGQSGLVVLVSDRSKSALVFSPQSGQEFRSALEHLSLIPREGLGESSLRAGGLNGFMVSDLVQTTAGEVGVILSIEGGVGVTLLTDVGDRVRVSGAQLQCKRSSQGSCSKDLNNQPIEPKCRVTVVRGSLRNKSGQVLHLWKNAVFVTLENGDVICVSAQDCLKSSAQPETSRIGAGRGGVGFARIVKKNPLIGKTVKILQGRYKGLLGDVIHVEPNQFTILLKVKPKTVRYQKSDCVILDHWHDIIRGHHTSQFNRVNTTQLNNSVQPSSNTVKQGNLGELGKSSGRVDLGEPSDPNRLGVNIPKWCVNGVVVRVIGPGNYYGKLGVIGEVLDKMVDTNLLVLHVMVQEDYIAIASESVEPVKPSKAGDQVLAFALGSDQFATVLDITPHTVTVQLSDKSTKTLKLDETALISNNLFN